MRKKLATIWELIFTFQKKLVSDTKAAIAIDLFKCLQKINLRLFWTMAALLRTE